MTDDAVAVTEKDIAKYQRVHQQIYGTVLSKEAATRRLHKLLRQMQAMYRPVSASQLLELKNEDEQRHGNRSH